MLVTVAVDGQEREIEYDSLKAANLQQQRPIIVGYTSDESR